jgi:hypothetical protein
VAAKTCALPVKRLLAPVEVKSRFADHHPMRAIDTSCCNLASFS